MAIFNVSDFKVVFGWVVTLLLCIAVYLYQTDKADARLSSANMEALIKENHQSLQDSLEKKEKDFKESIEKQNTEVQERIKEQNTKFEKVVQKEISAVTKQMSEFKIDQRIFVKDQKEMRLEQQKMAISIATLEAKSNIGGN